MMRHLRHSRPGVTLIEVMIVVTIVGLLIAIGLQLPRLMRDDEGFDPEAAAALTAVIENLEGIPLPTMWAGQVCICCPTCRKVSPEKCTMSTRAIISSA